MNLPKGWKKEESVRKHGISKGRVDVYIISPRGKKFRSQKELEDYIDKNQLSVNVEDFGFSAKKNKAVNKLQNKHNNTLTSEISNTSFADNHIFNNNILDTQLTLTDSSPKDIQNRSNSELCCSALNSPNQAQSLKTTTSSSVCSMVEDKKVFKTVSTQSDISMYVCGSLLAHDWVPDDAIQMYIDILVVKNLLKTGTSIIHPVVSQAIKCLNDYEFSVEDLNLQNESFVLIPVSNAKAVTAVAGSHWSLLCYQKSNQTFYYFDSIREFNLQSAKEISKRISKFLRPPNGSPSFKVVDFPQQKNGVDCGMYVILAMDWLLKGISETNINFSVEKHSEQLQITECDIIRKRACLAYLSYNNQHQNLSQTVIASLLFPKPQIKLAVTDSITEHVKPDVNSWRMQQPKMSQQHIVKSSSTFDTQPYSLSTSNRYESLVCEDSIEVCKQNNKQKEVESFKSKVHSHFQDVQSIRTSSHSKKEFCNGGRTIDELKETPVTTKSILQDTKSSMKRVFILSDSHGRQLSEILREKCSGDIQVISTVKPNAKFCQVVNEVGNLGLSSEDHVLLLAGANDVYSGEHFNVLDNLKPTLQALRPARVVLGGIPFRKDVPLCHPLNEHIMLVNLFLNDTANSTQDVQFLDLSGLSNRCYAKSGIHLNIAGKKILSSRFLSKLFSATSLASLSLPSVVEEHIKLIESDMREQLEKFCKYEDVAFAHCVSADFSDDKNMSAGVAKIFRKKFGKPQTTDWDCTNSRLAIQRAGTGSLIYSLVTKNKYKHKPSTKNYEEAFEELTNYFKKNKLKKLFCSPLGCVRDCITVERFANCIVRFQKNTGASVTVVTYNESSNKNLRNGQTFSEFTDCLRRCITAEFMKQSLGSKCCVQEYNTVSIQDVDCLGNSVQTSPLPQSPGSPPVVPGQLPYSEVVKCKVNKKQSNVQVSPSNECINNLNRIASSKTAVSSIMSMSFSVDESPTTIGSQNVPVCSDDFLLSPPLHLTPT